MQKVWIRRLGVALGLLLVLAAILVVVGGMLGDRKRQRQVSVTVQPVA